MDIFTPTISLMVYAPDGYVLGYTTDTTVGKSIDHYLTGSLIVGDAPAYYLDGDTVRETTAEERTAWVEAHKPTETVTQMDRIEAQVTYTAIMTDTLIEEDEE